MAIEMQTVPVREPYEISVVNGDESKQKLVLHHYTVGGSLHLAEVMASADGRHKLSHQILAPGQWTRVVHNEIK